MNLKYRWSLRREYVDAESEMTDIFIRRQHSEDARFIAPRKPQCPDSYRIPDNDRRIALQAHFWGYQEQRGSIKEHRLQLKFHTKMRIKRHSLDSPNYFLLGFTSVSVFGYTKRFTRNEWTFL